jgi:hypothetical protein
MVPTPAVLQLCAFERALAMDRIALEPDGSGFWVAPWADSADEYAARIAHPSFRAQLQNPDYLAGPFHCAASLWPIADNALSHVVLQHVIEFAEEPEAMLAEAARCLRGHGRLLVFAMRGFSAARFTKRWSRKPPNFTTASSWARVCVALGLADITLHRYGCGWPLLDIHQQSWLDRSFPSMSSVVMLSARKRITSRISQAKAIQWRRSESRPALSRLARVEGDGATMIDTTTL